MPFAMAAMMAVQWYMQSQAANEASTAAGLMGRAQKNAADAGAVLLDFNANVAMIQAQDAIERGGEAESRYRGQVRGVIGAQRAAIAASNIDVSFGSAADVQEDAAFLGELDALTIRNNAAREAWGYAVQATDIKKRAQILRNEGVMYATQATVQQSAMQWQQASNLIGGATSLLQQRYGMGSAPGSASAAQAWGK